MIENLAIASDHAAFLEKSKLIDYLSQNYPQISVTDLGPDTEARCNYPDFARAVSKSVSESENTWGILLCGSGIGMSMAANRYKNIRAVLCRTTEEAALSRAHNNSNILCLGARISSFETLCEITQSWLSAEFEGGRHTDRVALFNSLGETP
ncbi:MAG: ribose 5-phosphate isomerase B [Bacteriovoracaceae bacterium]|jgi:ribose 5-phosphate isomerase B|nr:ribose 5-phosphate isomerase B [Bacteriovoracaceae bacterium]